MINSTKITPINLEVGNIRYPNWPENKPKCFSKLTRCSGHCSFLFFGTLGSLMLSLCSPLNAQQPAVSEFAMPPVAKEDCALFQQGTMIEKDMPITQGEKVLAVQKWHFRPEYEAYPNPKVPAGQLDDSEAFRLDSATGQPSAGRRVSPMKDTNFVVLIRSNIGFKLHRAFAVWGDTPGAIGALNELEPITRTGEFIGNYQRIEVVNAREDLGPRPDIFVDENSSGQLVGVMACTKVGEVINPSCDLIEHIGPWEVSVSSFRRDELPIIETIKKQARTFVKCLAK